MVEMDGRFGRDDLVETVVAPAAASAAQSALTGLHENATRVAKYLARLKEVQHKRAAMEVRLKRLLLSCNIGQIRI